MGFGLHRNVLVAAACLAAVGAGGASIANGATDRVAIHEGIERATDPRVDRRRRKLDDAIAPRWRRSWNKPAKPKKRSNRLTISKRVRRKHRRQGRR